MRPPDAAERELIAFVMLALGCGFGGVALFRGARVKKRLRESVATKARVVDTVRVSGGADSRYAYRVVVEFVDEQGEQRTFTSRAAASGWRDSTGQDIDIVYRRDNPADARVRLWWVQWMLVTMLAGAAVVSFAVGAILLLFPDL